MNRINAVQNKCMKLNVSSKCYVGNWDCDLILTERISTKKHFGWFFDLQKLERVHLQILVKKTRNWEPDKLFFKFDCFIWTGFYNYNLIYPIVIQSPISNSERRKNWYSSQANAWEVENSFSKKLPV